MKGKYFLEPPKARRASNTKDTNNIKYVCVMNISYVQYNYSGCVAIWVGTCSVCLSD